jgi:hypothetical protein
MNPTTLAGIRIMLLNAELNKLEDRNNGKPLDDYGRAYLDGMIATLKTILDNQN